MTEPRRPARSGKTPQDPARSGAAPKPSGGRDRSLGVERAGRDADRPRDTSATLALAVEIARELRGDKCENILVLDLTGLSQVTDAFVVASGTSDRQMQSAGQHVIELAKSRGVSHQRDNLRESAAKWVIIDFVDLVVHLFEPDTREYYDLEMLWGDAKRIDWRRPEDRDQPQPDDQRNRAGLRDDDILPDRP